MGRDKATAPFKGAALVTEVYATVSEVFSDIIIVSSVHESIEGIDAPIVRDILPMQSPMIGIATALLHFPMDRVFVVGCDMPFLSAAAIMYLLDRAGGEDITIPRIGQYFEPLHALYRRTCLAHFLRLAGSGRLKIAGIFPYVTLNAVDDNPTFHDSEDRLVFSNINTGEELSRISTTATGGGTR